MLFSAVDPLKIVDTQKVKLKMFHAHYSKVCIMLFTQKLFHANNSKNVSYSLLKNISCSLLEDVSSSLVKNISCLLLKNAFCSLLKNISCSLLENISC